MVWYGQKGAVAKDKVQITQKTLSRFDYLRLKLGEKESVAETHQLSIVNIRLRT